MRRSSLLCAIALATSMSLLHGSVCVGRQSKKTKQKQRTSDNTPFLKKFLKDQPKADLNKDGVLTLQEAQAFRKTNQPNRGTANRPAPTHADVAYGTHERNVLDFWQAESDKPTPVFVWIHGGGFRAGNKSSIPADLLTPFLKAGVSVASVHYRLSQHAPYPAQMHDSARAIQFLRSKAGAWNIDKQHFAAGGGSAGSGISQWLAFHDEMAEPNSKDPLARESTRLSCALPINMQSTYDPREIKTIVPGAAYKHTALPQLYGLPTTFNWDADPIDDKLDALIKDAAPINHLTKDDAPIFLIHYERFNTPGNIHHANFGKHLKEAMDKLDIECVRKMDSDYDSMRDAYADMRTFVLRHFGRK